jgi:hypothetical protein
VYETACWYANYVCALRYMLVEIQDMVAVVVVRSGRMCLVWGSSRAWQGSNALKARKQERRIPPLSTDPYTVLVLPSQLDCFFRRQSYKVAAVNS